jgi:pimeloyl-ACP methyl ester carboxylesterase
MLRNEKGMEFTVLDGPLGAVVLRPWFDWVALRSVADWYFPLSRAWAAGVAAGGDAGAFLQAVGEKGRPPALVRSALASTETAVDRYRQAEARWQDAFLSDAPVDERRLARLEKQRLLAAEGFIAARRHFVPLHLARRFKPLRFEIAPPRQVMAEQGYRLASTTAAWPDPPLPEVERTWSYRDDSVRHSWLRFTSPVLGDRVQARVLEPAGGGPVPTLVWLHGIAMETDFWRQAADPMFGIVDRGLRVVRPEGPWHGHRRPEGWWGGEPAVGRGPLGLIELFQAGVQEAGALVRWARATYGGPVALGGVSLGALTSQMVAAAAHHWPADARPDVLLLVATSGALDELGESGSLVTRLGVPKRIEAVGWDKATRDRWLPLLAPEGDPALAPERIIMVLGSADDLTPYAGGRDLARRWGVPEANLFIRYQGHFSVSIGLLREPEPFARLCQVLAKIDV